MNIYILTTPAKMYYIDVINYSEFNFSRFFSGKRLYECFKNSFCEYENRVDTLVLVAYKAEGITIEPQTPDIMGIPGMGSEKVVATGSKASTKYMGIAE